MYITKLILIIVSVFTLILSACDALLPRSADADSVWRVWLQNEQDLTVSIDANGTVTRDADLPAINDSRHGQLNPRRFLPSGESLALVHDERFDALTDTANNAIIVTDPLLNVRFPFYVSANLDMQRAVFVQNGERVLIEGNSANGQRVTLLLERDGSLVRPLRDIERVNLHGTAQGFMYLLPRDDRTQLVMVDTRIPLSDNVVWAEVGTWQIIWFESGARGFGPSTTWAQRAPVTTLTASTVVASADTPTPFPLPESLFTIGGQATVNTVDGEVLYLRDAPSTEGEIVRFLYDDMIVDLLDGPVDVEGYRWWNIRTEDGEIGWAAEAVDTVTTLAPIYEDVPDYLATLYEEATVMAATALASSPTPEPDDE